MSYKLNLQLAKSHGMKRVFYRDLPLGHQMAIAYYMAIDGEAWKLPEGLETEGLSLLSKSKSHHCELGKFYAKALPNYIDEFINKYGSKKFGVVDIPMDICKKEVMNRDKDMADDHKDFEAYHRWYSKVGDIPKHTSRNPWPCILSEFADELFEDGWHRFHRYVQLGLDKVPCVIYI